MITLRTIRPSDINAIVSLSNRRLWQRHTGVDEWYADPIKKDMLMPWERLTLYQRFLNAGVWCDPILYKNHLNWLTRNGGILLVAEETALGMQRVIAFTEIWCSEEPSPIGKTGSIIIIEADTSFVEDPVSKLYTHSKKEIRARGFSTLAICPFGSRAVTANLDDRRWELLSLSQRYRIPRADIPACVATHQVEEVPVNELPVRELFCLDQSYPPHYLWSSIWEEFEMLPEIRNASYRSKTRKVQLEHDGQQVTAVIWIRIWSDQEDYWKLSIWVPSGREDDRELMYELVKIAAEVWNTDDVPGFELTLDEENGSFLQNRGFQVDESVLAEPRYYTAL
ncbi:MAG: hypothetical protein ABH878_10080 [bacterium]